MSWIAQFRGRCQLSASTSPKDGYGIRDYMVTEAKEQGVDTIITCDNGISAGQPIQTAKELGMTVVLTDHHEVPMKDGEELLPSADVIVDPKQSVDNYPYPQLCGAGIAYKLIYELYHRAGKKDVTVNCFLLRRWQRCVMLFRFMAKIAALFEGGWRGFIRRAI